MAKVTLHHDDISGFLGVIEMKFKTKQLVLDSNCRTENSSNSDFSLKSFTYFTGFAFIKSSTKKAKSKNTTFLAWSRLAKRLTW